MESIAFVPLRGGSKSIPFKNIRDFCGKPLAYWNIAALVSTGLYSRIVVATDSDKIADTVTSFGFSNVEIYHRTPESASDTASTELVMLEFIRKELAHGKIQMNDIFTLVQATSPLTRNVDFVHGYEMVEKGLYDSVLSCVRTKRFFWDESTNAPINYDFRSRPRRQEFKGWMMENGAFYVSRVGLIQQSENRLSGKIGLVEMPEYTSVEIDEEDDWLLAENMMRKHNQDFQIVQDSKVSGIKLVLTDVDGVLTDAGMYYSEKGDELKKFNTRDGMAFQLLRENNILTGIITSENTQIVVNRATKLKVDFLYQGRHSGGKLAAAKEIATQANLGLNEIAYIGDDINCFELLSAVGFAACPSDASEKIKKIPGIQILKSKGGFGVFREFVELILK